MSAYVLVFGSCRVDKVSEKTMHPGGDEAAGDADEDPGEPGLPRRYRLVRPPRIKIMMTKTTMSVWGTDGTDGRSQTSPRPPSAGEFQAHPGVGHAARKEHRPDRPQDTAEGDLTSDRPTTKVVRPVITRILTSTLVPRPTSAIPSPAGR